LFFDPVVLSALWSVEEKQMTSTFRLSAAWLLFAGIIAGAGQALAEDGIPVADPLVKAKCGTCHASDEHGNMQHISWERTTPEGWQDALRDQILANGVNLTAAEARSMVKYLSARHGLAPEEAKTVMYAAERRIHDETNLSNENLRNACAKCHALARSLSWRRSIEDWKQLANTHLTRHKVQLNEEAIAFLAKTAPLSTPEWTAWNVRTHAPNLAGRWLVSAYTPSGGKYYGDMQVDPAGDDEVNTRVRLTSIKDGSAIVRTGRSVVYGGYAWRGRSKGSESPSSAPDDLSSEMREAMWIAPDGAKAEGRWFWGQYQEFGFDVKLQRPSSNPTLLAVDQSSLKIGSQANRIRLIAENIPAQVRPADVVLGPGVNVRRIVSHTANEVIAEVDVAGDAPLGKRDVAFRSSVMQNAVAIYDRVDYVKVTPESAMAAFGNQTRARGYQQFEAIGYQRGADGKAHTADDVELGPVDVTWSMEVFYAVEGSNTDFVGKVSSTGFFTPAPDSPNNNYDVWVVATARSEKEKNGKPLVGKGSLVVTVPTYTFEGRQYVRDLDRWVDDGPARGKQ
jgi:quinohemoprotein amine dehydrogenase